MYVFSAGQALHSIARVLAMIAAEVNYLQSGKDPHIGHAGHLGKIPESVRPLYNGPNPFFLRQAKGQTTVCV